MLHRQRIDVNANNGIRTALRRFLLHLAERRLSRINKFALIRASPAANNTENAPEVSPKNSRNRIVKRESTRISPTL